MLSPRQHGSTASSIKKGYQINCITPDVTRLPPGSLECNSSSSNVLFPNSNKFSSNSKILSNNHGSLNKHPNMQNLKLEAPTSLPSRRSRKLVRGSTNKPQKEKESFPISNQRQQQQQQQQQPKQFHSSNSAKAINSNNNNNLAGGEANDTKLFRSTARNLFEDASNIPKDALVQKNSLPTNKIAPITIIEISQSQTPSSQKSKVSFCSESPLFKQVDTNELL